MKVFAYCQKGNIMAVVVSESGRVTVRSGYDRSLPDGRMTTMNGLLDMKQLQGNVHPDRTYALEMAIEEYAEDLTRVYTRGPLKGTIAHKRILSDDDLEEGNSISRRNANL